jgi:hypothetical protein
MIDAPRFPRNLVTTGFGYGQRYPALPAAVRDFVAAIVDVEWETPWPYDDLDDGPLQTFSRKLAARMGRTPLRHYRLLSRDAFVPAARRLVERVLWEGVDRSAVELLVTHNALEPFDPIAHAHLLGEDVRCIVVDRDPRDIYATAITTQAGFNDNLPMYRRIAGAHDVEVFIRRHGAYRRACAPPHPHLLRLTFESLIDRYEETSAEIRTFLELPVSSHRRRGEVFDPRKAGRNVGLWRDPALRNHERDFARIAEACGV